jgi:hypothetical protein
LLAAGRAAGDGDPDCPAGAGHLHLGLGVVADHADVFFGDAELFGDQSQREGEGLPVGSGSTPVMRETAPLIAHE